MNHQEPPTRSSESDFAALSDEAPGIGDLPRQGRAAPAPGWEDEVTPPVIDLPSSSNIIEGLLAENAALKSGIEAEAAHTQDKLALVDAALGDANAEIVRLRETLAAQTSEIADRSRQIEVLRELLEAGRGEALTLAVQRDGLETRLVDADRARAAVEAQLEEARSRLSELERRRLTPKLWQVFTRPAKVQAVNTPARRVFVIAGSITEAISRVVDEHKIGADDIANVVEFKTDVLIV